MEEGGGAGLGARPFRFEAVWTTSPKFETMMRREWRGELALSSALKDLLTKFRAWNMATFGIIFRRKKRNELRLGGIQRALAKKTNRYLLNLEKELREERSLLLRQEEILWHQKSHEEWLKVGDGNTKYFHTSTLIRRRRNIIEALLNTEGQWVEGKKEMKDTAVKFFLDLFRSDTIKEEDFIRGQFPHMEQE